MSLYLKIHGKKFRRIIGIYEREFNVILTVFSKLCLEEGQHYLRKGYHPNETKKRSKGAGRKGAFSSPGDKLFFLLYYLKNYPTMEALADHFNTSTATCSNTLKRYFPLMRKALEQLGVLPVREWKNAQECEDYIKEKDLKRLIVDASERRFHRPKDKDKRKSLYSGKKKAHTVKNSFIVDKKRYIHFLGKTTQGSVHDLRLLEIDLEKVSQVMFQEITLLTDLGYQGITNYFKINQLIIPTKKPRKTKDNPTAGLTEQEKERNKEISSERVTVEHVIGTIKRFKIMTDVYRNNSDNTEDLFIEIIAGVHNLEYKQKTNSLK